MDILKEYRQEQEAKEKAISDQFSQQFETLLYKLMSNVKSGNLLFPEPIELTQYRNERGHFIKGLTNTSRVRIYTSNLCKDSDPMDEIPFSSLPVEDMHQILSEIGYIFKNSSKAEAVWIDTGHKMGTRRYHKKEALKVIKKILKSDSEIIDKRDVEGLSEDDILDYGENHFSINLEQ